LPTAARDGLFRPEELVGGLAICEATAKVVSHGCRHSESRPQGHGGLAMATTLGRWLLAGHNRVDGPLVYWL